MHSTNTDTDTDTPEQPLTDTETRHQIQTAIDTLTEIDGAGTELITLTIPPTKTLTAIQDRIQAEHADAANIQSDRTRDHVQRALQRVHRELHGYDTIPENGLIVYAGVVDDDVLSLVFDDIPRPVTAFQYHCADHFDVTPLETLLQPTTRYGLLVVERGRAALGTLHGDQITNVRTLNSQVMGKTRAGGQSAPRFRRKRDRQLTEFFKTVSDAAAETFLGETADDHVTGVAIGGTLTTATQFTRGDYLDHRLQDRVVGTYSVAYATEHGLEQLVTAADEDLLSADRRAARDALDTFFTRLGTDDPVTYGLDAVQTAADLGAVETALIATTVETDRRRTLETTVAHHGGDVYTISPDTDRGHQFVTAFNGVGALLRFPIN